MNDTVPSEERGIVMKCYDCTQIGRDEDAVAVCRHCGSGVCAQHLRVGDEDVRRIAGMGPSYEPRKARHMTYVQCYEAESSVSTAPLASVG
ncbi:DUF2180 family protein [Streptomyces sp. TRM66268-LWL]|uniref:DUF2180 family protein n=1 Tax=Streptomyces polyasparticus TaxID=2767826 RepID=A0ABR7SES2_9ACTN|nr:DUF2180 family protein [Streptomyces polyasparticus]MBC9713913.1 DUF2180 family protein [Streptomyces polyasparticus]